MASTPLRPLLAASHLSRPRVGVASFASSSRIGLDFTRPRNAVNPTTSTTTTTTTNTREAPPHAGGAVPPPPQREPRLQRPETTSRPTVTPMFNRPTPSPASAHITPTARATPRPLPPTKKGEKPFRYEPEDPILSPNFASLPEDQRSGNMYLNKSICISHTLHVLSTRNNIHLKFVDRKGGLWGTISGGTDLVFKKSNRGSHEAAHQAALKMFERILEYQRILKEWDPSLNTQIRVAFKGLFGFGREAVSQAISGPQGTEFRKLIVRIEDRTPIKIGGVRAPKRRRI